MMRMRLTCACLLPDHVTPFTRFEVRACYELLARQEPDEVIPGNYQSRVETSFPPVLRSSWNVQSTQY